MPKISGQTKKGFTIIEVVLVLAIAGLIFLMVFLALPALQRSQRDTQRRDDLARFQTAIANYQTNNRGRVPGNNATDAAGALKKYNEFMINYLWAGGDEFVDPDGQIYAIGSVCMNWGTSKTNECEDLSKRTADPSASVDTAEYDGETGEALTRLIDGVAKVPYSGTLNHRIYIFQNAQCDGESLAESTGVRKIAIQYKLEGGGVYCGNN